MQSSATVLSLTEKKELPPRHWGFPGGLVVKESACQCRKLGFDFLVRKAPGEGKGNPLQDSCLGNPMGTELGRLQSIGSQSVRYNLVLIEHARTWTLLDHFLKRVDIIESRTCTISVTCGWNCSLSSISYWWWSFNSTIPHLLSLLQSVSLLACSHDASPCIPAIVLCYCTFQDTVL